MMLSYHDLGQAAAANDAMAEERSFNEAVEKAGLDRQGLQAFAEQRGIRIALLVTGQEERLKEIVRGNHPVPLQLDDNQQQIMAIATSAEIDGVAAGVRAESARLCELAEKVRNSQGDDIIDAAHQLASAILDR